MRLEYFGGKLSVVAEEARPAEGAEPVFNESDDVERVTIRMPARLKAMIDEAAAETGTSVNSWYIRILSRAVTWPFMRGGPGMGGPIMGGPPGWGGHRGRGRRFQADAPDLD